MAAVLAAASRVLLSRKPIYIQEMEMKNQSWGFVLLAALLIPAVSSAQKLERTRNWEVGDKLTYNLVMKGRPMRMVEQVLEVTDAEIRMTLLAGDRTYDAALSARDMSRVRGLCQGSGQACTWLPGDVWAAFPLETGKSWSFTMTVTNEGYVTEVASERKVEAVETVDTPAGQFKAYRVSGAESLTSMSKEGKGPYRGMATMTYWLASIKGKLVLVNWEYSNSFGENFTRELQAAELK